MGRVFVQMLSLKAFRVLFLCHYGMRGFSSPLLLWMPKRLLLTPPESTEALPTSVDTEGALERGEGNVLVKKRSETIEQAAPISVDEAASSTGCHPQSSPPVVTTMESIGDCGIDELLQPDYNITVEYRKYQRKYPQKKKTSKETNALPTQLGATLPLVSDTVAVLGSHEPVPVQQEEAVPQCSRM
ncbi:hypothetical protein IFM89_034237 [Coptis chinensis]|uniref:Uncharacterized protein n=1 Tax=Coptis chinensis TaxID=261450 RepID=A0A835H918_9MAGN|nr:hypothetical protein IFM89_034237 [Coptis chinensis]